MRTLDKLILTASLSNAALALATTKTEIHSFVLRVWFERTSDTGDEGEWRGHLTDAMTLDRVHFRSLTDMLVFLEDRLGERSSVVIQDDRVDEYTGPGC